MMSVALEWTFLGLFIASASAAGGCSSGGSSSMSPSPAPTLLGMCSQSVVPGVQSTAAVLAAQGPNCLPCAIADGCLDPATSAGCCEIVPGNTRSGGLTESALCFKTLDDIFVSNCAAGTLDPASCYCGAGVTNCLIPDAGVAPMGVLLGDYAPDFGSHVTEDDFESPLLGAGMANDVVHCVALQGCDCLGPASLNAPTDGGALE